MDSFEFNKIAGAVLGAFVFLMGTSFLAEGLFAAKKLEKPGYDLPLPAESHGASGAPVEAAVVAPINIRLADADAKRGENAAKKCAACHKFDKGAPNGTGPALWGIVQRPVASGPGYAYSPALSGKNSAKWEYDSLDAFLANPKAFAAGTKMVINLASPKERADIIAYLRTLADNPAPLPPK